MSPRKRRFETLEDRRLLSVLAGAPASPGSAVTAPASAAEVASSTPPVASSSNDSNSNDSTSSSDGDSTDNAGEYANAAPATTAGATNNAPSASASPSYSYAAPAYDNSYASTYATSMPYYTKSPASSSPSSASTSVQPTSTVPTLQAVNSNNSQGTTADSFAVLLPNPGAAPAASNSPPAARSPSSESLHVEQEARASVAEPVAMPTVEGADMLIAPVAQSDSPSDWDRLSARTAAVAEWFARAEPLLPAAEAGARSLLVGSVGVGLATLEDGIDAVFERFDRLGNDLADHTQVSRIGQWLILAGGACAAFEYARARSREGGAWQATNAWPILCEPRLRRRWFGRRKAGR